MLGAQGATFLGGAFILDFSFQHVVSFSFQISGEEHQTRAWREKKPFIQITH